MLEQAAKTQATDGHADGRNNEDESTIAQLEPSA